MKPTLLIDGDEYLYKATISVETEVQWDCDNHVMFSNAAEAMSVFDSMLTGTLNHFKTDKYILCFNGEGSFRKELSATYKSHRGRKPLCYGRLKEDLKSLHKVVSKPGLEGDDILGILATNGKHPNPVIISSDKDMKTIPATVYQNGTLTTYSVNDADYNWLKQTLTGDVSDGYPGLPGCGEVNAKKILNTARHLVSGSMWEAVVKAYSSKGLTEGDALLQARLARILRSEDYVNGKVKLWEPTSISLKTGALNK